MVEEVLVGAMFPSRHFRGFTLIEMLVVIGILAILIGVSISSFSKMTKSAERARAQELVSNAATALAAIYETDGVWPKYIRDHGANDGEMDEKVASILGNRGFMSVTLVKDVEADTKKAGGLDRFGIVTPWARKVIERKGSGATLSTPVFGSSTVQKHRLHYAVDLDGGGVADATVGGESVPVRAIAAVWCIGKSGGKDGDCWPYSKGRKKDDVYSWSYGQTQGEMKTK